MEQTTVSCEDEIQLNRGDFEQMKVKKVFDMFDMDSSNTLDVKELRKVFCALGNNPTDDKMREIMQTADKDGSKTIDYEEYKELLKTFLSDPDEEKILLREAFRIFDKDRTGTMERHELRQFMLSKGEVYTKQDERILDKLLHDMDTNGDGIIEIDEFVSYMCTTSQLL